MGRKRRRFSKEFKEKAVRELVESGATLADVSARLGVSIGNLSQWRTQFTAAGAGARNKAASSPATGTSNSKRIEELLKEIEQLREERDTLRKALSYLAKDL